MCLYLKGGEEIIAYVLFDRNFAFGTETPFGQSRCLVILREKTGFVVIWTKNIKETHNFILNETEGIQTLPESSRQ